MATEPRRLVRSFSELRPGMIIVIDRCDCGAEHRGGLIELVRTTKGRAPGFRMYPPIDCIRRPGRSRADDERLVAANSVEAGVVFAVEDGLESPEQLTHDIQADQIAMEILEEWMAATRRRERAR